MGHRNPGWIGVDLDGTLAQYDGWKGAGHIGLPVPLMLERVRAWLEEGQDVRIFTARVSRDDQAAEAINRIELEGGLHTEEEQAAIFEALVVREAIGRWCQLHLGRVLPITNRKDWSCRQIWDDRAIQVQENTGLRADGKA